MPVTRSLIIGIPLYLALTSCGSNTGSVKPSNPAVNTTDVYAKVYKYDGSLQCEPNASSLNDMRHELTSKKIDVICAQKANDGLVYPTMCGAQTGKINVYTLHQSTLSDAEKLGFKSVNTLPEYQDSACNN